MGRASKRKGYGFEVELVQRAAQHQLPAERAWGSNGAAMKCHHTVDCLIAGRKVQAKRRRAIPSWLGMSQHVDAVAIREDRGQTYVVLRFEEWLELLKDRQ